MPVSYRHIAGVSLERLAALSDGIFAVAMTLLVLGLSVRANNALHPARPLWAPGALTSEHVVWDVLRALAPHLLTYLLSFLTLGAPARRGTSRQRRHPRSQPWPPAGRAHADPRQ